MNRRTFIKACGAALAATRGTFAIGSETSPYKDNVKRLAEWIVNIHVAGDVNLVPDLPSGKTHGGTERDDLKRLFWLQNCNLFSFHALRPFAPGKYGEISDKDPRGLLKFGALGACLRGDKKQAEDYFQKALNLWDGAGFTTTKMEQHNAYYARYLAYVLIAERALHTNIPSDVRAEIERRLWALQDKDGGIWTNYYKDGSFPGMAKKTTESGPLALLAYNEEIWP